jgi:hypothetical protein
MEPALVDDLRELCPKLYRILTYFECCDGWYPLIKDLSIGLEKLINESEVSEADDYYATQVKEKYGGLRFYMSSSSDAMEDLIEHAEELSLQTCEYCGEPGIPSQVKPNGWITTLCDKCRNLK